MSKHTPITHERAKEAARRFINGFFKNVLADGTTEWPRAQIPASPDDDDLVLMHYLTEREAADVRYREALDALKAILYADETFGDHSIGAADWAAMQMKALELARSAIAKAEGR